MVTPTDIQLLQLNKLSSKLSSNQALVAVACSHKHKLNNKLLLVMEATLTTEELQQQLNSSNNNNNKQQQDSQKCLAMRVAANFWQKFLVFVIIIWLK